MNICVIGDGLISLTLAKTLINNKINVFMYCKNNKKTSSNNRTIGITSNNLDFFQKEIIKIKKNLFWGIEQIEIYNEQNKKEKILNFEEPKRILFSIIKNNDLYGLLSRNLNKSNNFKKIIIKNKFFYKKIIKNNKKAIQIFTKHGPIAFLPISRNQTSIIYSIKNRSINKKLELSQEEFEKLISTNNKLYEINSINKFETFILKSKNLRNYYNNNILAFGDMLHQIHPLSGQGFNMTLRDIRIFLALLRERESLGIPIDYSICKHFENKTKHLNFIFSSGNDFIYEFFNYDNFFQRPFSKKIFNYLNNNRLFNKLAIKYADKGLMI